jgi:hypothetical protein
MNVTCARCGRALSSATADCDQCAAGASAESSKGWGALDIQRAALPVQRRSLTEVQPENQQQLVSRNAHEDMRAAMTNSSPASEARAAPAVRGTPSPAPRARASTPQHPALRGSSPQHPARGLSAPLHPATRASTPRQAAVRAATGPVAAKAPAPAVRVAANPEPEVPGFDDRFGDASTLELGPALEIEEQPAAPRESERAAPVAAPESPALAFARQLASLSGYGAPPQTLLQTVPYFFRVALRKRHLQAQLSVQSQQRKRTELRADDALCAAGEALYGQRNDPRLAPLAAQLRLVNDARGQITSNAAAGKRVARTRERELDELAQRALRIKQRAEPFEQGESQLAARIELCRAKVHELEQQMRKLEAEQKTLRTTTQPAALEQIAALEAQLEHLRGRSQSLHVELLPLTEDLARARSELAKHMDELARIEEAQRKTSEAAERDSDRQRIAAGGAMSAYRETLRSLANAAARTGLSELAAPAMANATAAEAPIANERQSEELLRKALASYDPIAYQRGMRLVASSIVGTLLLFVLLIAF